jgi:hypothetical protein
MPNLRVVRSVAMPDQGAIGPTMGGPDAPRSSRPVSGRVTATQVSNQKRHSKHLATLRRECEERLVELALPDACDAATLCDYLSRQRGRPINLVPIAIQASHACGILVALDSCDCIFYEADTSMLHQEHIILHELGHMMWGHCGNESLDDTITGLFFPDIDPQLVRDMLGRSGYSDPQEQEAEMMASVLLQRLTRRPEPTWNAPQEAATAIANLNLLLSRSPRRSGR